VQVFVRYLPLLFFSFAFAVIFVVPAAFAVTFPVLLTVATEGSLELHDTGQYTPAGFTVAVSVPDASTSSESLDALRLMLVGLMFLTVILMVAFTFLFSVDVAVIVTFPAFFPVTTPFDETVATFVLLDLKVTVLLALAGFTLFTETVTFPLTSTVLAVVFKVMLVGFFVAAVTVVGTLVPTSVTTAASAITIAASLLVTLLMSSPPWKNVVLISYSTSPTTAHLQKDWS
jgi:hypothetical protein